jgi:peptidoglycan L-alanyl-D-glutamate endopeptidase CwlK
MPTFALSSSSSRRMKDVHPDLQRVAIRAIQITKVDFGIPEHGGKRTAQIQNMLYKTANKYKGPDGYEKIGKHQTGHALDFYAYVDGKANWEEVYLAQVACAFFQAAIELGVKIGWGGLFSTWSDMPHIELVDSYV